MDTPSKAQLARNKHLTTSPDDDDEKEISRTEEKSLTTRATTPMKVDFDSKQT